MIELVILKQFLNYDKYIKYNKYIKTDKLKDSNKELFAIYITLYNYYTKYQSNTTIEELETYFYSQRPYLRDKDKEIYQAIFKRIETLEVKEEVIEDVLKQYKQRQEAFDLSTKAYEVSQGKGNFADLITQAHSLEHEEHLDELDEEIFVTDNLKELYEGAIHTPGLRWRLRGLNTMLGSLRIGDFGFIFARPETGKTTFLASEVTKFAEQTTQPILWFNNEEGGKKVKLRLYQAALGLTLTELFSDFDGNQRKFMHLTGGRIKFVDNGSLSKNDVESLTYKIKPSLIIFDQIDKIKGFADDREDLRLGSIYQWARELAKQYCPVIGVCQADGTGEGITKLTMANVANAKTSKQAEADWIIGIGKSNQDGMEYVRHLHASKNKLVGDPDTDASKRHGTVLAIIKPDIARYEDSEY